MKILIVDDERYSVKAIRERVQWDSVCTDDAEVLAAYNYDQALKIITEEDPSIILCDIEMPRHNGIEQRRRSSLSPVTKSSSLPERRSASTYLSIV